MPCYHGSLTALLISSPRPCTPPRSFRPSISCYQGDEAQPITHPRGEAAEYAR